MTREAVAAWDGKRQPPIFPHITGVCSTLSPPRALPSHWLADPHRSGSTGLHLFHRARITKIEARIGYLFELVFNHFYRCRAEGFGKNERYGQLGVALVQRPTNHF